MTKKQIEEALKKARASIAQAERSFKKSKSMLELWRNIDKITEELNKIQ